LNGRFGLPDQRALNVLLVSEIGEDCLRRSQARLRLLEGRAIIGGLDLDDEVALVHGLKVVDPNGFDVA
jgi:hypothetical protein